MITSASPDDESPPNRSISMNVDQLIKLEIKTTELIEELEKEIAEADTHAAPPGQLDGTEGRLSRQDSLMRHQMDKESQRRRHLRLKLLHDAIQRMDAGEFGTCANCQEEIEFTRLEMQPETQLCGTCAQNAQANSNERR